MPHLHLCPKICACPTLTCLLTLNVLKPCLYLSHTVPETNLCLSHTCVQDSLCLNHTCVQNSPVPQPHLCPRLTCAKVTPASNTHLCLSYTCALDSPVLTSHLCPGLSVQDAPLPSYTDVKDSTVPKAPMRPRLIYATAVPKTHLYLSHTRIKD